MTVIINNTEYTDEDVIALINDLRRQTQELIEYTKRVEAHRDALERVIERLGTLRHVNTDIPALGGKG